MKFKGLAIGQKFVLKKAKVRRVYTKQNNNGVYMCVCNSKDENDAWCHINHESPVFVMKGKDEEIHAI